MLSSLVSNNVPSSFAFFVVLRIVGRVKFYTPVYPLLFKKLFKKILVMISIDILKCAYLSSPGTTVAVS